MSTTSNPCYLKLSIYRTKTLLYVTAIGIVVTLPVACSNNKKLQQNTTAVKSIQNVILDKDGNRYIVKKLSDNNLWIISNLKLASQGSYSYNDSAHHINQYGRLYSWEAAKAGCAALGDGWRLPAKEDWQQLAEHYGAIGREVTDIGKRAFYPLLAGGHAQFDAVLGGGRNPDGSYARMEAHGFYWTITQHDSANAWFANFAKGSKALYLQPDGEIARAFSVRCIKSTGY